MMRDSEAITKKVLEKILLGATLNYKPQQSNGEWDFDVLHSDGTVEALEVTAAVDRPQIETMARIRDKKKGGQIIPATKCKNTWLIFPVKGAHIPTIRNNADEYLARIEADGIERFHFPERGPQSVNDIVSDLQVTGGGVVSAKSGGPSIWIAMPGGGGSTGAERAVEAGELEAWKSDNRKKLGAAGTNERHLAVCIDTLNGVPWIGLTEFDPPSVAPNLPPEVTTLWLLAHTDRPDNFKVWQGRVGNSWQAFHVSI